MNERTQHFHIRTNIHNNKYSNLIFIKLFVSLKALSLNSPSFVEYLNAEKKKRSLEKYCLHGINENLTCQLHTHWVEVVKNLMHTYQFIIQFIVAAWWRKECVSIRDEQVENIYNLKRTIFPSWYWTIFDLPVYKQNKV